MSGPTAMDRQLIEEARRALGPTEDEGEALAPMAWPDPIDNRAYHGLAGEIVRRIEPTTEADPVALLAHLLAYFGSAAGVGPTGNGPSFLVEDTPHGANEFVALVGASSKARKGTAERRIRRLFRAVDEAWVERIRSGLSSGEGLIWAVRDEVKDAKGEVVDPGEPDKRLLIVESELAVVLRRIEREGSSLSPILRDAWDRVPLATLVSERSKAAVRASTNHVSVVGHITRSELTRYLTKTEMANGLGNRFLWFLVRRSKCLPRGSAPPGMADLVGRLRKALEFAWQTREMDLDPEADRAWAAVYPDLSEPKPGLAGELLARGEAHVLRLAMAYALLDCSGVIRLDHLLAALAVWQYCENSVKCIFGSELGDPDADALLGQLRSRPEGMTATELRDAFDRHWPSERIQRALRSLMEHGAITSESVPTRGRPATRFRTAAGFRPHPDNYVGCAVSAVSAERPISYSEPPEYGPSMDARKVEADQEAQNFPRTSRADNAHTFQGDSNTDSPLSALIASYRAYSGSDCPRCGRPGTPAVPDGWFCPYCPHRWGQWEDGP